jgi:hypothetical protein
MARVEVLVGLPDQDSAKAWGGRLLVDRDGAAIGTCTQIFLDDATGLPEWAQADLSEGPAVVPLMDAAESGDQVRVAVSRADVSDAPPVDDPGHISQDEEERLYRHYGITFSREASDTLLPVDLPIDQPIDQPVVPAAVASPPPSESMPPPTEVDAVAKNRGKVLPALAAGTVGVLAAVGAAVFWWRLRRQAPPTRKELLAARGRAASVTLASKKEQVATSAAPLLRIGRQVSASARERAGVQARAAAEQAAARARAAAQRAADVAAIARTFRLQRVSPAADLEPQPVSLSEARARRRRDRVLGALQGVGGLAAGYALGARAGGARSERATTGAQRRQLQQIAGRVQARMTDTLQAGNARVSQRAGVVADRVRRRSGGDSGVPSGSDDPSTPAQA